MTAHHTCRHAVLSCNLFDRDAEEHVLVPIPICTIQHKNTLAAFSLRLKNTTRFLTRIGTASLRSGVDLGVTSGCYETPP